MKTETRLFLAGAGVLVLTSRLAAQTLPLPEMPAKTAPMPEVQPSPGPPGEAPQAPAPTIDPLEPPRPAAWQFALGAGLAWNDNIDFRAVDGRSDVMLIPRGSIARVFRNPRGELRAAASGFWTGYREQKDFRQYFAEFGLDGTYNSSPRTAWQASASYGIGDSASARILREQGVALPRVKTRSLDGTLGVSHSMGQRSALHIEGRFQGTDFDSPDLIDGGSARVAVGLDREIGDRTTAGIGYALEHVLSDRPDGSYLTHFASVQWTRVVSRRVAVLLQGGASSTPEAARVGLEQAQSFFGGASVTGKIKRSSVTLFLRREVAPAFGTGDSRLDLRSGLRATIAMGRAWELRIDTSHVRPDGPSARTAQGASYDGFASLGRRLGGWLEVSADTRFRRLDAAGGLPEIQELQAGVFLSLLTGPGRGSSPFR